MAGSHIDITEQKQAQEALAQGERQLRTVLDALPVGVWFTDPSGKPVLANPAAKQIWSGIKQVRIESAPNTPGWWEAIGPSDELHRWALSHTLTKGIPSLNETLDLECLDGTMKTIRNTTVPVQDEAGVVLGAIVLNEDITPLRRAQEALKLTQFSVDHAVEGFFWIGSDARILNVNDAACRMLEYTRDELMAMTVRDIDPNFSPEVWSAHWGELKQKGSLTFESKHWAKTGHVLEAEVTVNYLQYDGREYSCAIMRNIGERKQAEASLRQSEERYRSLVDNAPIGIFVNDAGRFAYANREMQRILKAPSAEQLLGTPVFDRIAPEFHQMVKDRIRRMMDDGHPVPLVDGQLVRLDGSRVNVAVTAIPTSFDGGPVMQVLVLDITERKQAEAALREHHVLLSAIMDTATDFIYVKDLAGCYLLANPALARFMEKSVEQVLGQDDHALLPPDLAASCMTADQQVITTGATVTQEEYGLVGGTTQAYLTTKAPYRDYEGRIIGVIGVSRDISERKRAEEEIRKSHAFIRQIIDADPNFIFVKDRAGQFTLANKALADAYGTTVEHLLGKTDASFNANQEEVEFFRQKDLEVMDSLQERFIPEEVITDSTGKRRWLQTVKRPILDEQGQAVMVLGAATDITERKRMEEALRQRERDLRAAVEERERISEDLHDGILQSLFAVGLTLEATKSMMSPRNRKASGPPLDQAIDQLNRVMHEIRNFIAGLGSDLLQGKDLTTALQHMLKSLTQNQALRVRLAVEDRAAQAVSAKQALHLFLVIQEAVSNCIRHGQAPEASVSLKMLKQGVRLSIRDNGRGFNPKAAKGTGHGLTNMAARALKIGGRFTVLSKVNEGTRIVLDLPKEVSLAHS
jgi:PAS domain S-box-containing protein